MKVSFIGLVNLVAGRAIAPELIQGNATGSRLAEEGLTILEDEGVRVGGYGAGYEDCAEDRAEDVRTEKA